MGCVSISDVTAERIIDMQLLAPSSLLEKHGPPAVSFWLEATRTLCYLDLPHRTAHSLIVHFIKNHLPKQMMAYYYVT
jgi:hypothetical protein